jgi:hypothetical protein
LKWDFVRKGRTHLRDNTEISKTTKVFEVIRHPLHLNNSGKAALQLVFGIFFTKSLVFSIQLGCGSELGKMSSCCQNSFFYFLTWLVWIQFRRSVFHVTHTSEKPKKINFRETILISCSKYLWDLQILHLI